MVSGSARPAPPRGGSQAILHSPTPGQLCCAPISIQKALHLFAKGIAVSHSLELSTPPPVWEPVNPADTRPCIFLRSTPEAIEVLPLATFRGSEPESWNLLLQEIVVPIGAKNTIRPIFHDRPAFQSHPAWTHKGGNPTYILPQIVILPRGAKLHRLSVIIMRTTFDDLQTHCKKIGERLRNAPKDDIQRMITSFQANPYGDRSLALRPPTQIQQDPLVHVHLEVAKHTFNPCATPFVPRANLFKMTSFPDLANASNCGSTIAFSPPPFVSNSSTPSIHQALQENTPLPISRCGDNCRSKKPSRSTDDDKENMDP